MKFKDFLKHNRLLFILLIVSLLLRFIYIISYNPVWWDSAVYLAMGKYFYTLGQIGFWEEFRPILWPIIIGFFWKINLSPLLIGKIIELILSLSTIYLTYLIGERISKGTAIISATILSFTQIYFLFTAIQITDIPSLFFSVLAIDLILNKKYFFSGLSIGVAFNLRFPHAITLIAILIFIFFKEVFKKEYIEWLKQSLKVGLGFLVLALPYLFSNYIVYKDILLPFKLAKEVIKYSFQDTNKLFYIQNLIINNPLLIFTIIGLILYFLNFKKREKTLDIILIPLLLFLIYFSFENHKELRYVIAFLPYFCIFAGYSIDYLIEKRLVKKIKFNVNYLIFLLILVLSIIFIPFALKTESINQDRTAFNSFFKDKPKTFVYGVNPIMVAYSDIRFRSITSWEQSLKIYNKLKRTESKKIEYVAIDTCQLYCAPNDNYCKTKKMEFLNFISKFKLEFNKTVDSCNLLIYKQIE